MQEEESFETFELSPDFELHDNSDPAAEATRLVQNLFSQRDGAEDRTNLRFRINRYEGSGFDGREDPAVRRLADAFVQRLREQQNRPFPYLNMDRSGSDFIRFNVNGEGVRVEGPGAILGIIAVLLIGSGSDGAERRRREAAEEEAAQARKDAANRRREAEKAAQRAIEAEQTAAQDREAREAAEEEAKLQARLREI